MITKVFSKDDIANWLLRVVSTKERTDVFNPIFQTCKYCPRKYECPAIEKMLLSFGNVLIEKTHTDIMGNEGLGLMHDKIKLLKKVIGDAENFIKAHVHACGNIKVSDGRNFFMKETKRETIDITEAWEVMTQNFSGEQMATFMNVTKKDMMKIIRSRAGKGMKNKDEETFMELLRKNHAVDSKIHHRLTIEKE